MKIIKVEIKGTSPLLMNNPVSMLEESSGLKQKTSKMDMKAEAEKLAYKDAKGVLYIPAQAIKGCLVNAGAYKKFGKYSAKPIIAGGVHILPDKVSLGTKEYVIDLRTVVIQRSRVPKARPKIENWKAAFDLIYDENLISNGELLKPILEEAGKRVGLLDFRPNKSGDFGCFEIIKWQKSRDSSR